MTNFQRAFVTVIEHEGYYANVKGDRGGETYMGIARNIHPDWQGWKLIDEYKEIHGELKRNQKIEGQTIQSLVEVFYIEKYWKKNNIHLIDNYNLQYIIFDWCVNSGIYGAKHVQRLVGVKDDGLIGNKTIAAINEYKPTHLFNIIKYARIDYYKKIGVGTNEQFLKGWLNRIKSINYYE